MTQLAVSEAFYSTLADDPDLGEIVGLYVAEMPERVAALLARSKAGDRRGLATLAHQMKGAAGSHGFHQLTPYAARLEQLARGNAPDHELRQAVEALVEASSRVRYRCGEPPACGYPA